MLALLLNTCGLEGIVALAEDARLIRETRLPARATSEALVPAVREVLGAMRVAELGAVGVVVGPGSFTGVRVGLAAAKGLCEAGGVGMVAMSRLGLIAMEAEAGEANVFLDAGRREYFCGLYRGPKLLSERLVTAAEALRLMAERPSLTCEARVLESLAGGVRLVSEPAGLEMAAMVGWRVKKGMWSDVASQDANYLRRTDAELKVQAGG